MASRTVTYVREQEKVHSVRYVEETPVTPDDRILGTIYVSRKSGLAGFSRLRITIEGLPLTVGGVSADRT